MTFDARETSIEAGQPGRLYQFRLGTLAWRYTSADRTIVYADHEFESTAISDDGVRQTGETSADEFMIHVPHDLRIAELFRSAPPAAEIDVTVWDFHHGETDARVAFVGNIRGVRRERPELATLICQSDVASLDRPGLRLGWEKGCTHTVYDIGCGVSPALHFYPAIVVTATGATIEAGAWDVGDGFFAGGFVEWPIGPGEFDRRGIEKHVGGMLTLIGGAGGIEAGMTVGAHPGCTRSFAICTSRFNNAANYGGFPSLPGKSPFDGDPVF